MGASDSGSDGSTVDENDGVRRSGSVSLNRRSSSSPESSAKTMNSLEESYIVNRPSSPKNGPLSTEGSTIRGFVQSPNSTITGELSNTSSNRSDASMKIIDEGPVHEDMHDPVDFGQYFQEGYCKASATNVSHELSEGVTDIDSSNSPCDREKTEEDVESDGMLGGVFAFSEEGVQSEKLFCLFCQFYQILSCFTASIVIGPATAGNLKTFGASQMKLLCMLSLLLCF